MFGSNKSFDEQPDLLRTNREDNHPGPCLPTSDKLGSVNELERPIIALLRYEFLGNFEMHDLT